MTSKCDRVSSVAAAVLLSRRRERGSHYITAECRGVEEGGREGEREREREAAACGGGLD